MLSSGFQGAWPWPWWMWESSHKSTVTSSQTSVSCNQETGANSFSASCDHNQRTHRRKANDIPPYIAPATHLTVSSKLRISSSDEPWGVSKSSLVNDGRAVPNFYDWDVRWVIFHAKRFFSSTICCRTCSNGSVISCLIISCPLMPSFLKVVNGAQEGKCFTGNENTTKSGITLWWPQKMCMTDAKGINRQGIHLGWWLR